MIKLLIWFLIFIRISEQTLDEGEIQISLRRGLYDFLNTGEVSTELEQVVNVLQFPGLFRGDSFPSWVSKRLVCLVCNVFVETVLTARRIGFGIDTLKYLAKLVCILHNIELESVCDGFVEVNADTIFYIIDNSPDLTSFRVCSIALQSAGCIDPFRQNWEIKIPPKNHAKISRTNKRISSNLTPLKVLQLTDIHYDIDYTVGSNAACDEPLCCRCGTKPTSYKEAAGKWGDYRGCDTSWDVLTTTLNHITSQHKSLAYFYFTGDIVDHKLWGSAISRNRKVVEDVLMELKNSLGSLQGFPILGNHDSHPINSYSPSAYDKSNVSMHWVFQLVADKWQMWLPPQTQETILKGGYYTVLVKPGFRIVALNSNVCFLANWWLLLDDVDPYGQLKWLVDVLLSAEENGEVVHLLSHVPTAGDGTCFWNWGRELVRIIERFSETVVAQFNGHTHKQDTAVFFKSSDLSQPFHVTFNGGSLTPWYNVNPNYIIYDFHPETFEVLDFESWTYNITNANLTPDSPPKWYKLYSFKSAYGINRLSPKSIAKLVEIIAKNRSLAEQYFRYRFCEADSALAIGCDNYCHIQNLCTMVTPYYQHAPQCDIVKKIWNSHN